MNTNDPKAPNGQELFEHWLGERSAARRDPLSPRAAMPYRYIWLSWCRWLDEQAQRTGTAPPTQAAAGGASQPLTPVGTSQRYLLASAADVQQFLAHGPSPSSGRKSKTAPISEVTRRRYWRILDALYRHACNLGLLQSNPAGDLPAGARPPSEVSEGLVLPRPGFEALYQALPAGDSVWDRRDRAILLLLLEAAPTPGEICELQLHQVQRELSHPELITLSISGKRRWQSRDLVLSARASDALSDWIKARHRLGCDRNEVFVTQRLEAMARRPLFHLVARTIAQACQASGHAMPAHLGPQVLRNTRIVLWINDGMPLEAVIRLAGYKDAKSLRGLQRHIRPRARVPAGGHERAA